MKVGKITTALLVACGSQSLAVAGPVTLPLTARRMPRGVNGERYHSSFPRGRGIGGHAVPVKDLVQRDRSTGKALMETALRIGSYQKKIVVQRGQRGHSAATFVS